MKKTCVVCGTEFECKTASAKYCSKKCANHSRFIETIKERKGLLDFLKNETIKLYDSDKSTKEISKLVGKSTTWVRNVWNEAGLPKRPTQLQSKVIELRKQGLCCAEIAEVLKIKTKTIRGVAKQVGMPFTLEEKQRSIDIGKHRAVEKQYGDKGERISNSQRYIEEHHPDWIYISGLIADDHNRMTLQCRKCKSIVTKASSSVRSSARVGGRLICPTCQEAEKREKEQQKTIKLQQKEAELQRRRIQKEKEKEERFWRQSFDQMAVSFCKKCNNPFIGQGKYCSDECRKRAVYTLHKDKRLKRIKNRVVDRDIEIHKLYERDHGKCWLCGGKCDFEDRKIDQNGSFIAGEKYPSIDHVLPLSKGGLHSWNNVRLAHFYCNTLKSNKVLMA